ncbi:MAG: hypothetical protein QXZ48_03220 [Zestosphaera sp.]|nr:hypothetical protein [Thermoproteota archaeon]
MELYRKPLSLETTNGQYPLSLSIHESSRRTWYGMILVKQARRLLRGIVSL